MALHMTTFMIELKTFGKITASDSANLNHLARHRLHEKGSK